MPASADHDDQIYLKSLPQAYQKFRNAGAGIVNGRNAVEYAIKKIAIVNPQKIYCAGHSSAGNLALLLAATEPRISRCAAFAAAYDLESRMEEMTADVTYRMMLPGIKQFVSESSPLNHVDEFDCPLLIFHAIDDSNVPLADAEHFQKMLRLSGKDATHIRVTGDHYTPMIETGIPAAIDFFKQ
ncbi:prolyl oligopeptidase family protein [Rhodopirellula maiorica SM1]|uniref:Prolyl oligopeptidase family protein n=2 Tax=Novipirellula TaxID=2795426 RepID=M5RVY1_9BACT|nr:prolyl oligopeptidase family protein [Rhodopirellula maiorica SM1]